MSAAARVRLMLEIDLPDSWGDDWKLDAVIKSARESAIGLLRSKFPQATIRIIGDPEVTAVLVTRS